ncbi:RING-H2 finger protein ATL78 [Citrus sinensis]|uniref:RING-H2 finger protein ATL78 n=1 Tax=Citrus sinensis TaxID=2711 RepID=A0ACB8JLV7_CITSI|nr:RING-H2 finger protein ATL78 [Citrus sinensis]
MSTTPSTTTQLFQDFLGKFHSRKLLLQNQQPVIAVPPSNRGGESSFDSNVLMVLSVLLCALICAIGLASLVKCSLRCSRLEASESSANSSGSASCSSGIKQKALKTFTVVKYSTELKLPGLDTECVICLSEFAPGICLIESCQKIVECSQASSSSMAMQESVSNIVPLEPESAIIAVASSEFSFS